MKTTRNILIFSAVFFMLTFVKIYSQPVTSNEKSIKFETEQAATLVGHDGLIMRTEDAGFTWNVQNTGITNVLNSNDYLAYTDEAGTPLTVSIAVGENGVILKSADNGATWEVKKSGTTVNLNYVSILSADLIICAGNTGTIIVSVDLGETWTVNTIETKENLNSVMFAPDALASTVSQIKCIAVGDNGIILTSADFGYTWLRSESGTLENLNSVYMLGQDDVFAAGNNGTILSSRDCGITWIAASPKTTENIHSVKFLNSGKSLTGVASCDNGIILRSEDAGITWDVIQTASKSDLFALNFGSPTFGISVGENGTELYTTDGGATWENRDTATSTSGNIRKDADKVKLSQNYPNPFNPSTMISYELPFNASVTVKVFDLVGREVRTLASGYQASGNYNVKFDGSNLSSGIYFYVLRASSGDMEVVKTMRMILTK